MEYVNEKNGIFLKPYRSDWAGCLWGWMLQKPNRDLFRHIPRIFSEKELENFPELMGADVYFIDKHNATIGYCIVSAAHKNNRAVSFGMMIEEKYRNFDNCFNTLYVVCDHYFNKLGYRKLYVDVLQSNQPLIELLKKCQFHKEAEFLEEAYIDGRFVNEERWCLFQDDFNTLYRENY